MILLCVNRFAPAKVRRADSDFHWFYFCCLAALVMGGAACVYLIVG